MDVHVRRALPVTYEMVAKAYQKVKTGGESTGVDQESWEEFASKGVERQLYVVWNRLASGSYFPSAVREVEIPKKDGKLRKLGIPTIRDRIAQEVVRAYMEQRIDHRFHEHSYGYRPLKSSHEAVEQVSKNCLTKDWVVDLDIKNFFGELDHELLRKGLAAMIEDRWVMMYVDRWLGAKIERADGTQYSNEGKGTPQGGVISPLLANLYLHFALDSWLECTFPSIEFVRYADDVVIHCSSEQEAKTVLAAIEERLAAVKLGLNKAKSKIVYCKDYRRKRESTNVQFGFLGFSFQPRAIHSKGPPASSYLGFMAAISAENIKKIREQVRIVINRRTTTLDLRHLADRLNSKLRGWINYFGKRGRRHLRRTLMYVDLKLIFWLKAKHKIGTRAAAQRLRVLHQRQPHLFYHWKSGYSALRKEFARAV
jgi:group II intron reverse transcriptase/maturase